MLCPEKVVLNV